MKKDKRFSLVCSLEERENIRILAKIFNRSQGDMIRLLINDASKKIRKDENKTKSFELNETLFLLTVIEVARILQVSKNYIYKLISNGDLHAMKYSGLIRIQKEDLYQFIQSNSNKRKEYQNEKQ